MGQFDDVLAMEPGDEWDDDDAGRDGRALVDRAPLLAEVRLPNARVQLRGEAGEGSLAPLVDLLDPGLELWSDAPTVTLTLTELDGERSVVDVERGVVGTGASAGALFDSLVAVLEQLGARTDPLRLHLRAASVELTGAAGARGPGLIVVDDDRAARHELVCLLLERGARYLSADATVLLPGSRTTFAWPGPLLVSRHRSWPGSSQPGTLGGVDHGELDGHLWMAASTVGGPPCPATRSRVVAFVRRAPGASPALHELGVAEGCARLLRDAGALESFGPDALDVVAALAAESRFIELVHDDERGAADLLSGLDAPADAVPLHLRRRDRRSGDLGGVPGGRASVRFARFADLGGVLADGPSGRVLVLSADEADAFDEASVSSTGVAPDALARVRAAGVDLDVLDAPQRPPRRLVRGRRRAAVRPLAAVGLPDAPAGSGVPDSWHGEATAQLAEAWRSDDALGVPSALFAAVRRGAIAVDAALGEQVSAQRENHERRRLAAIEMLDQVLGLCRDLGAPTTVLGDVVLAEDGTVDPWLVDLGGVDLFVDPDDGASVADALRDVGYRDPAAPHAADELGSALELLAPVDPLPVRLHARLAVGPFGELVDPDELRDRSVPVRLGRTWARALRPDDRFVLSCLALGPRPDRSSPWALRSVVLGAPRTDAMQLAVLEASERWGATGAVLAAVRAADDALGGLSPWLVQRARRDDDPGPRRERRQRG